LLTCECAISDTVVKYD